MQPQHAALMLYTQFDDEEANGFLTQMRQRLDRGVQSHTGQRFGIFHPDDVDWGEQPAQRIADLLQHVIFLIPVLTPSFFGDATCREQVNLFLQRERELRRSDLILPIYYIDTPVLDDPKKQARDALAQELAQRQSMDWRNLRLEPIDAPVIRTKLAQMAAHISAISATLNETANHPLAPSLVHILTLDGAVVGAGFLADDGIICTCAHVVADALGIDRAAPTPPTDPVHVDMPYVGRIYHLGG